MVVPHRPRGEAPQKRAAGEENFGPKRRSPSKARCRRENFWPRKAPFQKRARSPQSSFAFPKGRSSRTRSSLSAVSCCLLLLLLPRPLLPPWQQPCCRAFRSHDRPEAARALVRRVGQGARRTSRRHARDARRVSAAFRRAAAAYGVANRCPQKLDCTKACSISPRVRLCQYKKCI